MNRVALRAARAVIVLDMRMKEVMQRKTQVPVAMVVIPPWAGVEAHDGSDSPNNPFRERLQSEGRVVVMYSGNHAITSPLTTLLAAIQDMDDTQGLMFVFVGSGAGKAEVEQLMKERPDLPMSSLPYQPRESLPISLAAADVHVVSIAEEAVGLVHPCKLYGAMAVGRPVIALAPADSYVGEIVAEHEIGWRVSHGDVRRMVEVLRQVRDFGRAKLREMGNDARDALRLAFPRDEAVAAVCEVVESVSSSS
jgi:glycosyltransferase involved in cell wall biosynthesis